MGGNVVINNIEADRIDLTSISRAKVVHLIWTSLLSMNEGFRLQFGFPIWNNETFNSKSFISGSGKHLFNRKGIEDAEFIKVKPSVGDIDLQVDINLMEVLPSILFQTGNRFGSLRFIGYKKSANQYITLWECNEMLRHIQIDFEFVEFNNGEPTGWSQFSHSADWNDMKLGLKGVAHKYLLRALTTKNLRLFKIKNKRSGTITETLTSFHAFSVMHGLREKLRPIDNNAYEFLTPGQSAYTKNICEISRILISDKLTIDESALLWSSVGILTLVNQYWNSPEKLMLAMGFVNTLWGEGAQVLYRNDHARDFAEKRIMAEYVLSTLEVSSRINFEKLAAEYYEFKRLVE